jgi:hypothetical protein
MTTPNDFDVLSRERKVEYTNGEEMMQAGMRPDKQQDTYHCPVCGREHYQWEACEIADMAPEQFEAFLTETEETLRVFSERLVETVNDLMVEFEPMLAQLAADRAHYAREAEALRRFMAKYGA